MTSRSPHSAAPRNAFTLVEVAVTLVLVGVLLGIAVPALQRNLGATSLQNGRAAVSSALATARSAATRWGRTSILRIDGPNDELWAVVDTGSGASPDTVVLVHMWLRDDLGVDLRSDRDAICFNSRGVGTTSAACPQTGATLILRHGAEADTLRVNSAGRIWR